MPHTLGKLVVLPRITSGVSTDVRLNPADPDSDVIQTFDPDVIALQMLPRRVRVAHAGLLPDKYESRSAIVDLVQNVGSGLFDLSAEPVKVGHIFSGGVWSSGHGFGFQLLESSATKSRNLRAKNTTGAATYILMDYIVQVSF